jgi:flagellar biosynthetic protein FlhB
MSEEDEGGERNEPATQKRIRQAREQGQVALSREAVGMAGLLASTATAAALLPGQVQRLLAAMRGTLARSHELGPGAALDGLRCSGDAWPVALAGGLGAAIATLAHTRGTISAAPMTPSLSKISPIAGAGRLLGAEALLEFGRTCLKLVIVAAALWMAAEDLPGLAAMLDAPPAALLSAAGGGCCACSGLPWRPSPCSP